MRREHCKSCGFAVILLPSPTGRDVAVNAGTVREGDAKYYPGRHTMHIVTCTNLQRKKRSGEK